MSRDTRGTNLDTELIRQYEEEYVLHPWVAQKGRNPPVIVRAKGHYFYDASGKQYLDFSSQFVFANLGHADDRVVAAISNQAELLPYVVHTYATEAKAKLAKLLAEITPGDIKKSYFCTSGSDANEGALKLARLATGKQKIIARFRAYHGSNYGALALSNVVRKWACEPTVPGVIHCLDSYCYRCPFGATYPNCDLQCAKHVEDVIRLEGGTRRVAALIAEPIAGGNGIIVPPEGYWQKVREICDKYEIMMICDEVMTGFGRTGKWFAIEHWGVVPDIITMAKGINSGSIPLGATSVRPWVAEQFENRQFLHGHTYSGHTIAMAAGVATIEAYKSDGLVQRSAEMGRYLMDKAQELQEKHPSIGDVRGKGLFVGLELVKDRKTKEPLHDPLFESSRTPTALMKVLTKTHEEGVFCYSGFANVIMLTPPLTITKDEIDYAISVLDRTLEIADTEARA